MTGGSKAPVALFPRAPETKTPYPGLCGSPGQTDSLVQDPLLRVTAIGGASGAHALDASIDHCLSEAFGPRRPSRWVNRERPKIDRIARFGLDDPGLAVLALIVRGANTDRHDLAPKAAGLHALSFGLALTHTDDPVLLAQELVLYDALYAWAVEGQGERHAWRPADIQTNTQEERLK